MFLCSPLEMCIRDRVGKTTYEVLKGVSLQVEKGEFVAVMGPSGSGKTTLLNCISCYIPADSGQITLGKTELAHLGEDALAEIRNRRLGFVFQDFLLLDGLTVRENILLPAIIGSAVNSQVEERADRPVSYTHLDVYKRQRHGAQAGAADSCRARRARRIEHRRALSVRAPDTREAVKGDVYKRQEENRVCWLHRLYHSLCSSPRFPR